MLGLNALEGSAANRQINEIARLEDTERVSGCHAPRWHLPLPSPRASVYPLSAHWPGPALCRSATFHAICHIHTFLICFQVSLLVAA